MAAAKIELTQILLNAQSADASLRQAAEEQLRQLQEGSYATFLGELCTELASNDKPPESRRLAGLVLKNALDAKDEARRQALVASWVALPADAKGHIKQLLVSTLGSGSRDASVPSAQVIAKVASIEVPRQEWPDLISVLLGKMQQAQASQGGAAAASHLVQAILECLGFVCEEIGPGSLEQEEVNSVLTAVVQGMRKEEQDNAVRLAATRALNNALEFAQTNFENEMERNYIMQVVCEACVCSDVEVRKVAFQCLDSIAISYYEQLPRYISNIFELTLRAVREDVPEVGQQALEFWCSVCEEESEINRDIDEGDSDVVMHKFIAQALPGLVPLLLETLVKQEEGQEEDDGSWNISTAGATCLGLVANTVGDAVVDQVMQFVQENVMKTDWRSREAGTMAFGSILDGPSTAKLVPIVNSAIPFLMEFLTNPHPMVKDTTAWTLGRMFEFMQGVEGSIINSSNLNSILERLLVAMKDKPNVAEKICWAIQNLATGFEDDASSPMAPFFQTICQALLTAAEREDAADTRLRSSAYEALNEVVRCSNDDTLPLVQQLVSVMLQKLALTFQLQVTSNDAREKQAELQGLLCGVLQVLIQKLAENEDSKPGLIGCSDELMKCFLGVFQCQSASVHEEAMLAIGSLADAIGKDFGKYVQAFVPYLEVGLKNFQEYQVCSVTVGVVGDVCRALEEQVAPFCDRIVFQLLQDLQSNELHRSVKPLILSCFGDIALAIGVEFEKYLVYTMGMLQSASALAATAHVGDEEAIEYVNLLRIGIFEAYTGIFQGFKKAGSRALETLVQYAEPLLSFLESVCNDKENRDDFVTRAAVGLLGDLAHTLGTAIVPLLRAKPFWHGFMNECAYSEDERIRNTAQWAGQVIGGLEGSG